MTCSTPVPAAVDADRYTRTALHFDVPKLPALLAAHLSSGPHALADFGCGDGPWFALLARLGHIAPVRPVCAVDLEEERLRRVKERFPFITTCRASADDVPQIDDGSMDWVLSTMVMEHVPDERRYLDEIRRVLRSGGRAYITTVFKKPWAWYFRKRNGESVLDTSHLREYTNLDAFKALLMGDGRFSRLIALEVEPLLFYVLDPVLFRLAARGGVWSRPWLLRPLRIPRVPVLGYYELSAVVEA
jgi:ubiquinone/menaquinone biosynthesis C-methylase UbiE